MLITVNMGDMLFQNEADPQPGFTSSSSVGITDPAPPISLIDAMRPLDLTGYVTITDRSIDGGYGQVKTGFLEMDGTIFNVSTVHNYTVAQGFTQSSRWQSSTFADPRANQLTTIG